MTNILDQMTQALWRELSKSDLCDKHVSAASYEALGAYDKLELRRILLAALAPALKPKPMESAPKTEADLLAFVYSHDELVIINNVGEPGKYDKWHSIGGVYFAPNDPTRWLCKADDLAAIAKAIGEEGT